VFPALLRNQICDDCWTMVSTPSLTGEYHKPSVNTHMFARGTVSAATCVQPYDVHSWQELDPAGPPTLLCASLARYHTGKDRTPHTTSLHCGHVAMCPFIPAAALPALPVGSMGQASRMLDGSSPLLPTWKDHWAASHTPSCQHPAQPQQTQGVCSRWDSKCLWA
jgi:hypothetical protein